MGYENIFIVECVEDSIIYWISASDLRKLADQIELFDEIKDIESKYMFTGCKYDYTVFLNWWKTSKPNSVNKNSKKSSDKDKSSEKDS